MSIVIIHYTRLHYKRPTSLMLKIYDLTIFFVKSVKIDLYTGQYKNNNKQ